MGGTSFISCIYEMYCGFNKEQSIAWAMEHLGPVPARVTVHQIEQITDKDDIDEDDE